MRNGAIQNFLDKIEGNRESKKIIWKCLVAYKDFLWSIKLLIIGLPEESFEYNKDSYRNSYHEITQRDIQSEDANILYEIVPYGRLGNRLIQIANMLYFCEEHGANCLVPETEISKEFYRFEPKLPITKRKAGGFFYDDFVVEDHNKCQMSQEDILKRYLLPNLKFDIKKPLPSDVAVINIRSGEDVFGRILRKQCVSPAYIQGPLSYCQYFVRKFSKCYLITQPDMLNPVIKLLLKEPNVELVPFNLIENIKLMLSSRNIISGGFTTFTYTLAKLNPFLDEYICLNLSDSHYAEQFPFESKRLFFNHNNRPNPHAKVIAYNIKDTNYISEWKCKPEQLKMMVKHKFDESKIAEI